MLSAIKERINNIFMIKHLIHMRKPTLWTLRQVSTRTSMWIFCFRNHSSKPLSPWDRMSQPRSAGTDCAGWSGLIHFARVHNVGFLSERLIDWGLTPFSKRIQTYHSDQFTYSYVSWFPNTSSPHNILSKQLAAFPHIPFAHLCKTNVACHGECCQTAEIMFLELGYELTACVATDWATGTHINLCRI